MAQLSLPESANPPSRTQPRAAPRAIIGEAPAIMHEMSIAGSMLEAVRAEAARLWREDGAA